MFSLLGNLFQSSQIVDVAVTCVGPNKASIVLRKVLSSDFFFSTLLYKGIRNDYNRKDKSLYVVETVLIKASVVKRDFIWFM